MDFFRRNQGSSAIDGVIPNSRDHDGDSVRETVKSRLVGCIKDLHVEYGESNSAIPIETNELTHNLVTVIEAIFIHALKGQPTKAVKATNHRSLPEPSFWTFVLIFTHKETISFIEKLSAIRNDVGRGRAWLRLAMNDGLLCSYLSAMTSDKAVLRRHYHRHSMLRDADTMDVFIRYLRGIEIYRFNIALNSGLLNRWTTGPLIIAGLCISDSPAADLPPLATAVDVVATMETAEDPLAATSSDSTVVPATSNVESVSEAFEVIKKPAGYLNRGLLNEDEALKLILAGVSPVNFSGSSSNAGSPMPAPSSPVLKKKEGNKSNAATTTVKKNRDTSENDSSAAMTGQAAVVAISSQQDVETTSKASSGESSEVMISKVPEELVVNALTESSGSTSADLAKGITALHQSSSTPQPSSASKNCNDEDGEEGKKPSMSDEMSVTISSSVVKIEEESDEDDEEELMDIYRRRNSSSQDLTMSIEEGGGNESAYITCMASMNDDTGDNEHDTSTFGMADQLRQVTSYVSKRAGYGLSSSRSSDSDSSLTLASVPHLSGFIDSWHPFGSGRYFDTPPKGDALVQCGFSLKPHVQVGTLSEEDSQQLMLIFDLVVREEGLDVQNYECAECTKAIGTIFGPAKICAYTKRYYCGECHVDETTVIPAKIMYNWDFRQFRVCHKAKLFLTTVNIEPIIDVKSFNGELFSFAPSLSEVFDLRRQLRYMNAYLSTCADGKSQAKSTFTKMLWPRQYLYEDIDMYSIRDLEEIHSGRLVALLSSVVKFSLNHILKCVLCSGKGFICEICRQNQVIFPFELDSIMQCKQCYTVFHLDCSMKMTTCPKCDRIEARNLNWQVSLSKSQRLVVEAEEP